MIFCLGLFRSDFIRVTRIKASTYFHLEWHFGKWVVILLLHESGVNKPEEKNIFDHQPRLWCWHFRKDGSWRRLRSSPDEQKQLDIFLAKLFSKSWNFSDSPMKRRYGENKSTMPNYWQKSNIVYLEFHLLPSAFWLTSTFPSLPS